MRKLLFLLFLTIAWSISAARDVSDPEADALGTQIMEALRAVPVDCPPRLATPFSVLFCGQLPDEYLGYTGGAKRIKSTID